MPNHFVNYCTQALPKADAYADAYADAMPVQNVVNCRE